MIEGDIAHPGARRAVGAAVWQGHLLIHGGFGIGGSVRPDAVTGDLWRWHGNWARLANGGPPAARYPSLCVGDDGVYRFGGCGFASGSLRFFSHLWRWNEGWREVRVAGPAPQGRYTSALASRGGGLVVFGGYGQAADGARYYGDVWRFDRGSWSLCDTGGVGPGGRYGFGWVQAGERLYIFGGFDGRADRDDFWSLDLDSLVWTRLPGAPPARYCPALGTLGEKVVLFGGRSKTDPKRNFSDTWIYDGTWRRFEGPGPGYHAKAAYASDGNRFWI